MPKISIIVPYKNSISWIEDLIKSVIQQTFCDWELILVDDHSNDGSYKRTEILINKNNKYHIQQYKNKGNGVIQALNTALNQVSGEYITRIDSDDIMPKNRLELMHKALSKAAPKTIVTGYVNYFSDTSISDGYKRYESWLNERVDNDDYYKHIYRECTVASPNWMMRTDELKSSKIFKRLILPEDYDMLFYWMEANFKIVGIPETTLLWREHDMRTSKTTKEFEQEAMFALKLNWFKRLHSAEKSVGILGAGIKGKLAHSHLKPSYSVRWFDLNHSKYNTPIDGSEIEDYNDITTDILLIAIYPSNRKQVETFLQKKGYQLGKNAWYL